MRPCSSANSWATDHKMSMLQDLELGRLTSVRTPVIDAVLALIKERARASGLYEELATL